MSENRPLTILGQADSSPDSQATCPLYLSPVNAGWPSAAEDYIDGQINLYELIVRNPAATFSLRTSGESMIGVGIRDGDLLVVVCFLDASHNKVVIAALDSELLVKELCRKDGRVPLQSANPDYPEFDITEMEYAHIWGVGRKSALKLKCEGISTARTCGTLSRMWFAGSWAFTA